MLRSSNSNARTASAPMFQETAPKCNSPLSSYSYS